MEKQYITEYEESVAQKKGVDVQAMEGGSLTEWDDCFSSPVAAAPF